MIILQLGWSFTLILILKILIIRNIIRCIFQSKLSLFLINIILPLSIFLLQLVQIINSLWCLRMRPRVSLITFLKHFQYYNLTIVFIKSNMYYIIEQIPYKCLISVVIRYNNYIFDRQMKEKEMNQINRGSINKIMNKVYEANVSSRDVPYVHAMHKTFHRKFFKVFDDQLAEMLQAEALKNIFMLNESSIKNKTNISENSMLQENLSIFLKPNQLFDQPNKSIQKAVHVTQSEINNKSSQRLQEQNKKIEMKKKNQYFQGNVSKSDIKKMSQNLAIIIDNRQDKKDKQIQILKEINEQKKPSEHSEPKNKDAEEQQQEEQVQVVDEPTFYSLKLSRLAQIPQTTKLVTKSSIENSKKQGVSIEELKKYTSEIKPISSKNIPQNMNSQLNVNSQIRQQDKPKINDKIPQIKKQQSNIPKQIDPIQDQKKQIKLQKQYEIEERQVQQSQKEKIILKQKEQRQDQVQNDKEVDSSIKQNGHQNTTSILQANSELQSIHNDLIQKQKSIVVNQDKSNLNISKESFSKEDPSVYIDSPQTQQLSNAHQISAQFSQLNLNDSTQVIQTNIYALKQSIIEKTYQSQIRIQQNATVQQQQQPVIEIQENIETTKPDYSDYKPKKKKMNLVRQSHTFKDKVKSLLNDYTVSFDLLASGFLQKNNSQEQALKTLQSKYIQQREEKFILKRQNQILWNENERLKFEAKLKVGEYELKITVLNNYIKELKQKLESQQFFEISNPNKNAIKRKKSQDLSSANNLKGKEKDNTLLKIKSNMQDQPNTPYRKEYLNQQNMHDQPNTPDRKKYLNQDSEDKSSQEKEKKERKESEQQKQSIKNSSELDENQYEQQSLKNSSQKSKKQDASEKKESPGQAD